MKKKIGIVFFFTIPVFSLDFSKYSLEILEVQNAKLKEIIRLVDDQKYYLHPIWLKLVHYKKTIFGWESQIDSPNFFLSYIDSKKNFPIGKWNPRLEFLATIESFFLEEKFFQNIELHPICAFPARKKFIQQILNKFFIELDHELPKVDCKNYQLFNNEFKTKTLSLVFASYYLGAPASVFGHTFLKINSYERDEILDYSINYAANPGNLDPIRYAIYGLFGGYQGYYSVMPYYIKIKEYNDIESRDLWEYELNLSEEQIDWILKHNWELANFSYSDYFFATENCSYKLLTLLQIGLENTNYIEDLQGFVIPSETVKTIKNQNLIKKRIYRPSIKSQILQRYESMNLYEKNYFNLIIKENLLPEEITKENFNFLFVYDTSLLYFKYKKIQSKLNLEEENFYSKLLIERTQYPIDKNIYEFKEYSTPPEESHYPSQIQINYGMFAKKDLITPVVDFSWRYLYHDFLNNEWGLPKNSELENFSFLFRYESKSKNFYISQFKLMNIYSLNTVNSLFFLPSYHVEIGYKTNYKETKIFKLNNFILYSNYFDQMQNLLLFYQKEKPYYEKSLQDYSYFYGIVSGGISTNLKKLIINFLFGLNANEFLVSPILENLYIYKMEFFSFLIKLNYYIKNNDYFVNFGFSYHRNKNFEVRVLYEVQKSFKIYQLGIAYLF